MARIDNIQQRINQLSSLTEQLVKAGQEPIKKHDHTVFPVLSVRYRFTPPWGTDMFGEIGTIQESFTTNNGFASIFGAVWQAQGVTPLATYGLTRVILLLYREGSPGTVTVSIRANSNNRPTGPDLASGTFDGNGLGTDTAGAEQTITMTTPVTLHQGTLYHIVVRATAGDASNKCLWRLDVGAGYPDGKRSQSANSGSSWSVISLNDMYFKTSSQEKPDGRIWVEGT